MLHYESEKARERAGQGECAPLSIMRESTAKSSSSSSLSSSGSLSLVFEREPRLFHMNHLRHEDGDSEEGRRRKAASTSSLRSGSGRESFSRAFPFMSVDAEEGRGREAKVVAPAASSSGAAPDWFHRGLFAEGDVSAVETALRSIKGASSGLERRGSNRSSNVRRGEEVPGEETQGRRSRPGRVRWQIEENDDREDDDVGRRGACDKHAEIARQPAPRETPIKSTAWTRMLNDDYDEEIEGNDGDGKTMLSPPPRPVRSAAIRDDHSHNKSATLGLPFSPKSGLTSPASPHHHITHTASPATPEELRVAQLTALYTRLEEEARMQQRRHSEEEHQVRALAQRQREQLEKRAETHATRLRAALAKLEEKLQYVGTQQDRAGRLIGAAEARVQEVEERDVATARRAMTHAREALKQVWAEALLADQPQHGDHHQQQHPCRRSIPSPFISRISTLAIANNTHPERSRGRGSGGGAADGATAALPTTLRRRDSRGTARTATPATATTTTMTLSDLARSNATTTAALAQEGLDLTGSIAASCALTHIAKAQLTTLHLSRTELLVKAERVAQRRRALRHYAEVLEGPVRPVVCVRPHLPLRVVTTPSASATAPSRATPQCIFLSKKERVRWSLGYRVSALQSNPKDDGTERNGHCDSIALVDPIKGTRTFKCKHVYSAEAWEDNKAVPSCDGHDVFGEYTEEAGEKRLADTAEGSGAFTAHLFEEELRPLMRRMCLTGEGLCVLACGTTATGKTHTLFGKPPEHRAEAAGGSSEDFDFLESDYNWEGDGDSDDFGCVSGGADVNRSSGGGSIGSRRDSAVQLPLTRLAPEGITAVCVLGGARVGSDAQRQIEIKEKKGEDETKVVLDDGDASTTDSLDCTGGGLCDAEGDDSAGLVGYAVRWLTAQACYTRRRQRCRSGAGSVHEKDPHKDRPEVLSIAMSVLEVYNDHVFDLLAHPLQEPTASPPPSPPPFSPAPQQQKKSDNKGKRQERRVEQEPQAPWSDPAEAERRARERRANPYHLVELPLLPVQNTSTASAGTARIVMAREVRVRDADVALAALKVALSRRRTHSTPRNAQCSGGHVLVRFSMKVRPRPPPRLPNEWLAASSSSSPCIPVAASHTDPLALGRSRTFSGQTKQGGTALVPATAQSEAAEASSSSAMVTDNTRTSERRVNALRIALGLATSATATASAHCPPNVSNHINANHDPPQEALRIVELIFCDQASSDQLALRTRAKLSGPDLLEAQHVRATQTAVQSVLAALVRQSRHAATRGAAQLQQRAGAEDTQHDVSVRAVKDGAAADPIAAWATTLRCQPGIHVSRVAPVLVEEGGKRVTTLGGAFSSWQDVLNRRSVNRARFQFEEQQRREGAAETTPEEADTARRRTASVASLRHVPYRSSVLTELLRPALAKTLLITCLSPCSVGETVIPPDLNDEDDGVDKAALRVVDRKMGEWRRENVLRRPRRRRVLTGEALLQQASKFFEKQAPLLLREAQSTLLYASRAACQELE